MKPKVPVGVALPIREAQKVRATHSSLSSLRCAHFARRRACPEPREGIPHLPTPSPPRQGLLHSHPFGVTTSNPYKGGTPGAHAGPERSRRIWRGLPESLP